MHEREFFGKRERTARKDQLVIRQGVDVRWRVYRTHDVAMLRRSRERGQLKSALGKKNRPPQSSKSPDGVVHRRDLDPAVTGLACPREAGENHKWRTGCAAGGDRVGRHARGERMGRVDDRVDVLARQEGDQTLSAAEAADPPWDWRWSGVGCRSRERKDRRDIGPFGNPSRKRARLRCSAENEQAKSLQWAAP